MRTSESIDQIVAAIAKARPYFNAILKTEDNPFYKSKYADLATYINAVAEPLAECGVILTGGPEPFDDQWLLVSSRVCHISGQWMECATLIKRSEKPQDMGSGITYARRYTLAPLLGLASDDDDGNAASQETEKTRRPAAQSKTTSSGMSDKDLTHPTADQVSSLVELARSCDVDLIAFGQFIRQVMNLTDEVKVTRKFLRESMTMPQYDVAWQHYSDLLKQQVEEVVVADDVPTYPDPSVTNSSQDETSPMENTTAAVPPERASEGSSDGKDGTYANTTQIAALKDLARKVGDDASVEVQDLINHNPNGIVLTTYELVKRRLNARLEANKDRVKQEQP